MVLTDIVLVAAAISWLTTAIVYKTGPFNILLRIRHKVNNLLGSNSPLTCAFCTSFWVGVLVVGLYSTQYWVIVSVVQIFGILGIAVTLRGMSGIWE
jgi:hypothetical protein